MRQGITRYAMTGMMCVCFVTAAISHSEDRFLQVGDVAPEIQSVDDRGRVWSSRNHLGKNLLVVYFYPSDFSFCCTRQAQRYRDLQNALASQGAKIVGVSGDAVESHRIFKATHGLNFTLLADTQGNVAGLLGVPLRKGGKALVQDADGNSVIDDEGTVSKFSREFTAARWTFVVDKDGTIIYREMAVSPVKDSRQVLQFLQKRNGQ